jgi:hypothetical protein
MTIEFNHYGIYFFVCIFLQLLLSGRSFSTTTSFFRFFLLDDDGEQLLLLLAEAKVEEMVPEVGISL